MQNPILRWWLFWLTGWLLLVVTFQYFLPLMPIDETRYMAVAWEMWLRHDFLVPHLNGETYAHKPPLLFWLINLGWQLFGVNEWWPRLVPGLFVLGSLLLTQRTAGLLWPQRSGIALWAPTIMLGSLYWAFFTPRLMFDMIMVFFTLLALFGVLLARRGNRWGWGFFAAGIGLGLLTKGPVILLYTLPPALLAPLWMDKPGTSWWHWYTSLLAGVAGGAALVLCWVIPAVAQGGADYENALLWKQTTGRMVESFAHDRPFWWYLPLLPIMLSPWLLWGGLWKAFAGVYGGGLDRSSRMLLYWMLLVLAIFSLIGGKQPHYLLPLYPAFALLSARCLDEYRQTSTRLQMLAPALLLLCAGAGLLVITQLTPQQHWPEWIQNVSPATGLALLGLGGLLLIPARWTRPGIAIIALSSASVVAVVVLMLGVIHVAAPAYDLQAISRFVAQKQAAGEAIANNANYHGQFHFFGRLQKPLQQVRDKRVVKWAKRNPDGWIIFYPDSPHPPQDSPVFWQPYRSGSIVVRPASQINASPPTNESDS
jgi:4-amino-4-deoxy-L-arabinose transferase-like glycosyltransferase